jgi:beta-glucosidase
MPGDTDFFSGRSFWGGNLTLAVVNGTIPEWRIDDMAVRIMAAYYKVGNDKVQVPINFASWTTDTYGPVHYFAHKGIQQINYHVDVRDEHASLIRDIGARAAVLLKNVNNALPLNKPKFLAVLGEDAGSNQYGPNGCPDRGCNNGTMAVGWGSGTASYPCELMAFVKDCKIEGLSDLEKKNRSRHSRNGADEPGTAGQVRYSNSHQ